MSYDSPTLPKGTRPNRKKYLLYSAIGAGIAAAIIVILLFTFHTGSQQYSVSVEPRSEMVMGTGMMVRVYIKNTGSEPLTNISINWGSEKDILPVLNPGEKVMYSPPSSATMVTVTADQGINIMKPLTDSMK